MMLSLVLWLIAKFDLRLPKVLELEQRASLCRRGLEAALVDVAESKQRERDLLVQEKVYRDELASVRGKYDAALGDLARSEIRITELEAAGESLLGDSAKLSQDNGILRATLIKERSEAGELRKRYESKQRLVEDLKSQIVALEKAVQSPLELPDPKVLATADSLAKDLEGRCAEGTSGEWKRHQVYAALIKKFPETDKRKLSVAIEAVL